MSCGSLLITLLFLLVTGCSPSENNSKKYGNQKGEYVYRKQEEVLFIPSAEYIPPTNYFWNKEQIGHLPKISKEYFRCKGSSLNPFRIIQKEKEIERIYDCGGTQKHSLPLQDGKEFVYPILIDLLSYIQLKTEKRVVISCGHRCPEHHRYADPSIENQYSKHMIGAEVSFYVQGFENKPEQIIQWIQNFYKETARYQGQKDYLEFKRYEKPDTNVSIQPWFNKEIFIKLFNKKEGRNFDNRHPYPYISIQVRHDRDLNEKVTYTWIKANRNYHRW
jgi:hypothetical protein